MKVTNNSGALQGINTPSGVVWLRPGQTLDVNVPEKIEDQDNPQYLKLLKTQHFGIEGVERKFSPTAAERTAALGAESALEAKRDGLSEEEVERLSDAQRMLDSANEDLENMTADRDRLQADLTTAAAKATELQGQLDTANEQVTSLIAERDSLKAQVDQLNQQLLDLQNPFKPGHLDQVTAGLDAKHKGSGSYSIFSGETEVLTGLKKVDIDEFDKLENDRQKTDWVNSRVAPAA